MKGASARETDEATDENGLAAMPLKEGIDSINMCLAEADPSTIAEKPRSPQVPT